MTLTRSARFAAVVLASALLAGCAAQAETLGASKIALAGGGIEITAAPLPEAAFTACADKITGDKAAKAARRRSSSKRAIGIVPAPNLYIGLPPDFGDYDGLTP